MRVVFSNVKVELSSAFIQRVNQDDFTFNHQLKDICQEARVNVVFLSNTQCILHGEWLPLHKVHEKLLNLFEDHNSHCEVTNIKLEQSDLNAESVLEVIPSREFISDGKTLPDGELSLLENDSNRCDNIKSCNYIRPPNEKQKDNIQECELGGDIFIVHEDITKKISSETGADSDDTTNSCSKNGKNNPISDSDSPTIETHGLDLNEKMGVKMPKQDDPSFTVIHQSGSTHNVFDVSMESSDDAILSLRTLDGTNGKYLHYENEIQTQKVCDSGYSRHQSHDDILGEIYTSDLNRTVSTSVLNPKEGSSVVKLLDADTEPVGLLMDCTEEEESSDETEMTTSNTTPKKARELETIGMKFKDRIEVNALKGNVELETQKYECQGDKNSDSTDPDHAEQIKRTSKAIDMVEGNGTDTGHVRNSPHKMKTNFPCSDVAILSNVESTKLSQESVDHEVNKTAADQIHKNKEFGLFERNNYNQDSEENSSLVITPKQYDIDDAENWEEGGNSDIGSLLLNTKSGNKELLKCTQDKSQDIIPDSTESSECYLDDNSSLGAAGNKNNYDKDISGKITSKNTVDVNALNRYSKRIETNSLSNTEKFIGMRDLDLNERMSEEDNSFSIAVHQSGGTRKVSDCSTVDVAVNSLRRFESSGQEDLRCVNNSIPQIPCNSESNFINNITPVDFTAMDSTSDLDAKGGSLAIKVMDTDTEQVGLFMDCTEKEESSSEENEMTISIAPPEMVGELKTVGMNFKEGSEGNVLNCSRVLRTRKCALQEGKNLNSINTNKRKRTSLSADNVESTELNQEPVEENMDTDTVEKHQTSNSCVARKKSNHLDSSVVSTLEKDNMEYTESEKESNNDDTDSFLPSIKTGSKESFKCITKNKSQHSNSESRKSSDRFLNDKCNQGIDKNKKHHVIKSAESNIKDISNRIYKGGQSQRYTCPVCDFATDRHRLLVAHRNQLHKIVPTECEICHKIYPNRAAMTKHRRMLHWKPKYAACDICGKIYSYMSMLNHKQTHKEGYTEIPVSCKLCSKSYKSVNSLSTHTKKLHAELEASTVGEASKSTRSPEHMIHKQVLDAFGCDLCTKSFMYLWDLRQHIGRHKIENKNQSTLLKSSKDTELKSRQKPFDNDTTVATPEKNNEVREKRSLDLGSTESCLVNMSESNSVQNDQPGPDEYLENVAESCSNDDSLQKPDRDNNCPTKDHMKTEYKNRKQKIIKSNTVESNSENDFNQDRSEIFASHNESSKRNRKVGSSRYIRVDREQMLRQYPKVPFAKPGAPKKIKTGNQCSDCDFTSEKYQDLVQHMRKMHTECDICHKVYQNRRTMRKHRNLHLQPKNVSCDVCGKVYTFESMRSHKKVHQEGYKDMKEIAVSCKICSKPFGNVYNLRLHIQKQHSELDASFSGSAQRKGRNVPKKANTGLGLDPFGCDLCSESVKCFRDLHEHVMSHKNDKDMTEIAVSCKICSKSFRNVYTLRGHTQTQHSELDTSFSGSTKRKGSGSTKREERNVPKKANTCLGLDSFGCDLCSESFKCFQDLYEHVVSHKNDSLTQNTAAVSGKNMKSKSETRKSLHTETNATTADSNNETLTSQKLDIAVKPMGDKLKESNALSISESNSFQNFKPGLVDYSDSDSESSSDDAFTQNSKTGNSCLTKGNTKTTVKDLGLTSIKSSVLGSNSENDPKQGKVYSSDKNSKSNSKVKARKHRQEFLKQLPEEMFAHRGPAPPKKREPLIYRCLHCDYTARKHRLLVEHRRKLHPIIPTECDICHKIYRNMRSMKRHRRTHSKPKRALCDFCGKHFSHATLKMHQRTHMEGYKEIPLDMKDAAISQDIRSLESENSSVVQTDVHSDSQQSFACDVCGKVFQQFSALSHHLSSHRNDNNTQNIESGNLNKLDSTPSRPGSFGSRVNFASTDKNKGVLDSTNFDLATESTFLESAESSVLSMKSNSQEKNSDNGSNQTKIVDKESHNTKASKSNTERKRQRKSSNRIAREELLKKYPNITFAQGGHPKKIREALCHPCSDCKFTCESKKLLIEHRRIMHANRPTECNICHKIYPSKRHMQKHRLHLHKPKYVLCDVCGKTVTSTAIHFHKKMHQEGHKVSCPLCFKSFSTKGSLGTHVENKHSGVSNTSQSKKNALVCDVCGKIYKRLPALHRHLLTHKGEPEPD